MKGSGAPSGAPSTHGCLGDTGVSLALPERPPSGKPCRVCKRARNAPNKCPNHRPGKYLVFGASVADCASCRALVGSNHRGVSLKDYGAFLGADLQRQAQYDAALVEWEEAYNNSSTGRVTNSKSIFKLPVVVQSVVTAETRGEMLKGVFWEKSVWKEH